MAGGAYYLFWLDVNQRQKGRGSVVVMFVIRWVGALGSKHAPPSGSSALQILKERFARGEIDEAEFERRKHHLSD